MTLHAPWRFSAGLIILPLYFLMTILIGLLVKHHSRDSNSYLNASRSLPLWVVTAAYLAANCGALEIVGLSAMAVQYGVKTFHFYWIGAIPAMVFLAMWMMPVYRRSGVRSVPEFLNARYGSDLRFINSCVLGITMLLLAGISLYAMGQILGVVIGLPFAPGIALSAGVVLAYILLGGVRATIYNEVFQLLVMLAGLVPLAIRSVHLGLTSTLVPAARDHLWRGMPIASQAAPLDGFGVVFGLGVVLSFGYWCTDFVLMQRAFTARTDIEARQVPLWAGFGKLIFSLIVVLPGLAAFRLFPELRHAQRFDQALPELMTMLYGPTMLGLGLTALAASLMSGLAANVSAFAAILTEDIYRARIRKHRSETHYLLIGRASAVAAILISMAASYLNFLFSNLMEHVQLIFAVFGAPFFAIFLLGMATRRTTEKGAIAGFVSGTVLALAHLVAVTRGWLHYGSLMSANFHAASDAFLTTLCVSWLCSGGRRLPAAETRGQLEFDWRASLRGPGTRLLWVLSVVLLLSCFALNVMWR